MAMTAALIGTPPRPAYAATSSDLFAEANAIVARVNALQSEINAAQADYDQAMEESNAATQAMNEADARIRAADARTAELQGRLAERAEAMYKNGPTGFLDVLFGVSSFEDFLTSWDMIEKIGTQDADLVQETKDTRAEAEAARQEYADQQAAAAAKMAQADALKEQVKATQASLKDEADKVTAEAVEALAQEELGSEQARQAASAAEAMRKLLGVGPGTFTQPCPGNTGISSPFGWRDFDNSFHKGCDFAAPIGTPIYAADKGTVLYATNDGGYNGGAGNWVVIVHGNGLVTKYMHASAVYVSVGQQVDRGQQIAAVGTTGDSSGPHLHFQVEYYGVAVDPLWLL